MSHSHPLPLIAIIGKPNVGKSALFNRLIRQRKAIVAEEPGVTRDINYEIFSIDDHLFLLADTAGFVRHRSDMDRITRSVNTRLIGEAALILFTCEIKGLNSEDFELGDVIRKSGKPCILTVNKVDNERLEEQVFEFYELGFGTPVPVSASHGRNISTLTQRIVESLIPERELRTELHTAAEKAEKSQDLRATIGVAIVGKPNVGKSSLLNLLVNKERALVMPEPGTTRDTVDENLDFHGHTLRFIDTAGLRKRRKVREGAEFYSTVRTERAIREASVSVLVLDATEGISSQDKKIAWIVAGERRGLIIAANKWDLMKGRDAEESRFVEDIYYHFPHVSFAEIVPVSASTGYNKTRLLKKIIKVYNNYYSTTQTADINSFLRNLSPGGSYIKYGYQRGTAPPRFEFFVRSIDIDDTGFKRHLANALRKNFDLTGVPIEISLRKK